MRRRTAEDRNKNKKKNNKPSSRTKPEPKKLVQARIVRVEPSNAPAVSIANDDYYFSDDDDTDDGCSSDEVVAVVAAQVRTSSIMAHLFFFSLVSPFPKREKGRQIQMMRPTPKNLFRDFE